MRFLRSLVRRCIVPGRFPLALGLGILLVAGGAEADTVTLQASKDNTLFEDPTGSLSNGAGDFFYGGRTNSNDTIRRGLVAFDVAGQIPAGSTINSVTLTLYLSRVKNGTYDFTLNRVLADWGEGASNSTVDGGGQGAPAQSGDATWLHRFYPSTLWASPGGDFAGTASATTSIPNTLGAYSWSSAGMAADVQGWLDNPGTNFGWTVRSATAEATKRTARRFDSRENPVPAQRPMLQVDYTPAEVVGACCLPGDVCSVLTQTECANQGGSYQGDGTSCSPDPCVVPTGACCFDDGSCQDLTEADCQLQGGTYEGDGTACATTSCPLVLTPWVDALPIPGVATPVTGTPGGAATYEVTMTQFQQQLHRDLPPTTVWGYNGSYPGPTIEAGVGQPITVTWINDLRDSTGVLRTHHYLPVDLCMHGPNTEGDTPRTVVHLHGGHVPPASDGYPEDTFLPGQQTAYVYENNQLPATLWYHDHALGITRLNVQMGLAGFYLLRDAQENALDLPSGAYEIPLVIQDRSFNPDGSFQYPASWEDHFFGDKILVNGKVWPYLDVDQGKYRFRILNGSNSRTYTLNLSNGDPMAVIGTDGGLLSRPVLRDTLTLAPAERADVVIDFTNLPAGTEIVLINSAPAPYPGTPGVGVIPDVLKFIVQASSGFTDPLPGSLRNVPPIPEGIAVEHRDFTLAKTTEACAGSQWLINGLGWDDITELPVLGTTEVWRFINESGIMHPMHMHLVMFQILDRQPFTVVADSIVPVGDPIPPDSSQAGWKDTVPVYPGEMVRVIATFSDYTGKYAYHCHILEHEDHEMMRQFEVVSQPTGIDEPLPVGLLLSPNRPNPFASSTQVSFHLVAPGHVRLRIFDITGREVRRLVDGVRREGPHQATWDGRDELGQAVRSGIYVARIETGGAVATRKLALIR